MIPVVRAVGLPLVLLLTLAAQARADEPITWATDGLYTPFSTTDHTGAPAGLDHAIAVAVCDALKRPCRFQVVPWPELYPGLKAGHFDILYSGMSRWTVSAEGAVPSVAYFSTAGRFVTERGRLDTVDIMAPDIVIGVLAGTPHARYLEDTIGNANRLRRYADQEEMYFGLLAGAADVVFGDGLALYHDVVRPSRGLPVTFVPPAIKNDAYFDGGLVFALRPGDTLSEDIARAVQTLHEDGRLDVIIEQHLPGYTLP
ncbi:MAG: transporter substrate-binding domain-containing protein [Pseudomonadota bacterium]